MDGFLRHENRIYIRSGAAAALEEIIPLPPTTPTFPQLRSCFTVLYCAAFVYTRVYSK